MGAGLTSVASSVAAAATAATGVGIIASVPLGFTAVATGVLSVVSAGISKILLKKIEKHQQIKKKKKKKKKIDLPTLPIFRPKGQTDLFRPHTLIYPRYFL